MKVRFLLDENMDPALMIALRRREPIIDSLRVGDPEAPARGAPDPAVLRFAEGTQRVLITSNRASMDSHLAAHYAAGGHHWGIPRPRHGASLGRIIEELYLM
jgi:hypothetical protein